jgi:hypothetical protein
MIESTMGKMKHVIVSMKIRYVIEASVTKPLKVIVCAGMISSLVVLINRNAFKHEIFRRRPAENVWEIDCVDDNFAWDNVLN